MGYCDRFDYCWHANVSRDDLDVRFLRLFMDGRDEMSDVVRPQWKPVDDFIIEITGKKKFESTEVKQMPGGTFYEPYEMVVKKTWFDIIGSFEIRTKSKSVANYIWWLAKKKELSFEELKEMNEARMFD